MLSQSAMRTSRLGLQPFRSIAQRNFTQSARRAETPKEGLQNLSGVYDNAFNRERAAVKKHAKETSDFWRKLSIYVVVPALVVTAANTWVQWNEHWEHQAHLPPLEERPQYSYQNIRTKSYPWGDGDKTLFWNSKYNYNKKE